MWSHKNNISFAEKLKRYVSFFINDKLFDIRPVDLNVPRLSFNISANTEYSELMEANFDNDNNSRPNANYVRPNARPNANNVNANTKCTIMWWIKRFSI